MVEIAQGYGPAHLCPQTAVQLEPGCCASLTLSVILWMMESLGTVSSRVPAALCSLTLPATEPGPHSLGCSPGLTQPR